VFFLRFNSPFKNFFLIKLQNNYTRKFGRFVICLDKSQLHYVVNRNKKQTIKTRTRMSKLISFLLIVLAFEVVVSAAAVISSGADSAEEAAAKHTKRTISETVIVSQTTIRRAHGRFIGPDVVRSRRRVFDSSDLDEEVKHDDEKRAVIGTRVLTSFASPLVVVAPLSQRTVVVSPVIAPAFAVHRLASPLVAPPVVLSSIGLARDLVFAPARRFL
jgi:hypothetical protein